MATMPSTFSNKYGSYSPTNFANQFVNTALNYLRDNLKHTFNQDIDDFNISNQISDSEEIQPETLAPHASAGV